MQGLGFDSGTPIFFGLFLLRKKKKKRKRKRKRQGNALGFESWRGLVKGLGFTGRKPKEFSFSILIQGLRFLGFRV